MPSLVGPPGLWKAIGAGGLPVKSFGGSGWIDRINRNPGYLTITTIGASGFVSVHRRFMFDWQVNANRRVLMRRADQLSLGQRRLVTELKGGCAPNDPVQPPCFPSNLLYQIGTPPLTNFVFFPGQSPGGFSQLRDPHTGLLLNNAGFYNMTPWASDRVHSGVGEVVLGGTINLLSLDSGRGVAIGFRPHISIPTRTGLANLQTNGVQTGSVQVGGDLLMETHAGNAAGLYLNAGYTYVHDPKQMDLYNVVPIRVGVNIPRTSRVQLLVEYASDFFVGSGTPNVVQDLASDGTVGFRGYITPWLSISGGYRHTLNHSQYGGDKNGFVAQLAGSYVPIEAAAAPVPPTVTCTAEPAVVRPGGEVRLSATASTTTGGTLTYTWSSTGGRIEGSGPTARLDTTGLAPGTYTVTVRVDDGRGGFADCTSTVTVEAPPPPPAPKPPTVTCSVDKTAVAPGETVTLTATASSPDNRPLNYDWTVTGGRITGSGATVRWDTTNVPAGTYTATVRVTDDRGLTADCSTTLSVQAPPPPPRAAKLNECSFKLRSVRVDNVCKAVLDDVALRLQNEAESRAVVVGSKTARERPAGLAAQRASNVKGYLVHEKGIDTGRVEVRASTEDARKVEIWLVPRGANAADVPGAAAAEKMPPAPRKRAVRKAAKKAAPAETTGAEAGAKKAPAKKAPAK